VKARAPRTISLALVEASVAIEGDEPSPATRHCYGAAPCHQRSPPSLPRRSPLLRLRTRHNPTGILAATCGQSGIPPVCMSRSPPLGRCRI
jgi:hypothetical protein